MVKSKYKVDKDVCYRLEWGGELAKLGNKLDAVRKIRNKVGHIFIV